MADTDENINENINENAEEAADETAAADGNENSEENGESGGNAAETAGAKPLTDRDVTAHTAAMWKYNPVPEKPEPFPESVFRTEREGGITVTAASVRGKKHKHEGSNGDDFFAFEFFDGAVIAAVADGAGSKPFSRIGAKASCEAVLKFIKMRLAAIKSVTPDYGKKLGMPLDSAEFGTVCSQIAETLRDSYAEAYASVEAAFEKRKDLPEFEEAIGRKPELKDFSCTLLAAMVIPAETPNGTEYLTAAIQLGDGMIAAVNEEADFANALIILGAADSGSFAGETEFITSEQFRSPEALMSRTKIRRGKFSSLMMMTDGVADDYYPNVPQLLRLALDMKLNGVIDLPECSVPEDISVPEPVAYPWVNDGDVSYTLQYAKHVLAETGMTLEELWNSKGVQKKASLKAFGTVHEKDKAEMLKVWLDNYVERGSFDDRTLLLISV